MPTKISVLGSALALAAGVVIGMTAVAPSSADKGGCPNAASINGAAHANPNSAHGPAKQAARGCAVLTTPTATGGAIATPTSTELGPTQPPTVTPTESGPTVTATETPTPT